MVSYFWSEKPDNHADFFVIMRGRILDPQLKLQGFEQNSDQKKLMTSAVM